MRLLSLANLFVFILVLVLHGTAIQGRDEPEASNTAASTDNSQSQVRNTNVGSNRNSGKTRGRGRYILG